MIGWTVKPPGVRNRLAVIDSAARVHLRKDWGMIEVFSG